MLKWCSKTWLSVPRFKGLESLISRRSTPEIAMLGKDYFSVCNYRPKWGLVFTSRESNAGSGKNEAKVGGDGSTEKGSGTPCSGAGMMAAPGQAGECISREAFESNPKAYFADLHAKEKAFESNPKPKPNK